MGFPRDYLDFTMWYLKSKDFITIADNSDFTITAQGVDLVESNRAKIPLLNRLLSDRSERSSTPEGVAGSKPLIMPGKAVLGLPADGESEPELIYANQLALFFNERRGREKECDPACWREVTIVVEKGSA